jgi:hypothetical protein
MKVNEQSGTPSQNQDWIKCKEFLKRAQDEYKNLQNEHKKENENPMLEQCQSLRQPSFYLSFVKLLSLALI